MDTCVIPLRHGGLSLVQTTDYIYPIVDDPYMMVWTSPVSGMIDWLPFGFVVSKRSCTFICPFFILFFREELLVPMF